MNEDRALPRLPVDLAARFRELVATGERAGLLHGPGHNCTRRELADRSTDLAPTLARTGMGPGSIVALAVPNGQLLLAGLLAAWQAGAIALLLDAAEPARRRRSLAAALGAHVLVEGAGDAHAESIAPARELTLSPEIAVIKMSSGSTGEPRGIAVSASALVADARALEEVMGIGAADRVLAAVPMSFSYGLGSLVVPALWSGRQLVVPDAANPLGALAAIRSGKVTVLPTVPAVLDGLTNRGESWHPPASLRLVISAGAPLRPDTARAFRERTGLAPHVFYGASECGGITYDSTGQAAERGTVGRPVPGVEVSLSGDQGRVTVRSPAVAAGYVPVPEPILGGGRFVSSDLGRCEDGELRLLGRCEELIQVSGSKFSPREVENVIAGLPGVAEVVVRGTTLGCTAFVVTRDPDLGGDRVTGWCRERLPPQKTPRAVRLVTAIPRTARGKVDVTALEELISGRRHPEDHRRDA